MRITKEEKIAIIKDRINRLENKPINLQKCTGVLRKLYRELRNAETEV